MGRLQSRAIGEVVAPVALLSGIALSPEGTLPYGRLRRNTVISLLLPFLVLLGIGFPPPSTSCRSCPVAKSQPTLFYMALPRQALLHVPVPFSLAGSLCCGRVHSGWGWL